MSREAFQRLGTDSFKVQNGPVVDEVLRVSMRRHLWSVARYALTEIDGGAFQGKVPGIDAWDLTSLGL